MINVKVNKFGVITKNPKPLKEEATKNPQFLLLFAEKPLHLAHTSRSFNFP